MRLHAYIGLRLVLAISSVSICSCTDTFPGNLSLQEAIDALDRSLAQNDDIVKLKESHIDQMRSRLYQAEDGTARYQLMDGLFDEYLKYDMDSALSYAHRKADLAQKLKDKNLILDSEMDLAARYILSGMFYIAKEILEGVSVDEQTPISLQEAHSRVMLDLYHGIRLSTQIDPELYSENLEIERRHKIEKRDLMNRDKRYFYTSIAAEYMEKGEYAKARDVLQGYLESGDLPARQLALLYYDIAKTYYEENNLPAALSAYAVSARHDLSICTKTSRSLIRTAVLCLEMGHIRRAYRYITFAYNNAVDADAHICLMEIASFMPIITQAYEDATGSSFRRLAISLTISILLLALSVTVMVLLKRLNSRIHKADKEIKSINQQLSQNVAQLKEANEIMDFYLGRYLSMFSSHIGSLESYRSNIRAVAKNMDIQEIQKALRSNDFIDNERQVLYEEFDRTFLGIFPNFVNQLNALLKEDKRIGLDLPAGKLTNELRIFALIRLGVNQSGQIATFLKMAPSTIYNYRVKLRNAAKDSGEDFEKKLMEIGQS